MGGLGAVAYPDDGDVLNLVLEALGLLVCILLRHGGWK